MASKKYSVFLGLLFLLVSGSFAQIGGSYDIQDSSVIPSKRLPQHTEFMANNYPFPALPRNQWEIGIKVGAFSLFSDVRSRFPGFGAGLHVRKALGYVFSLKGELGWGTTKGLNWEPSRGYGKNPAWAAYVPLGTPLVFYNYKTNIMDASLEGVVTLNNIRFHRAKTGFNVYAFGGIGGMVYDTKIDALDANGAPYNFSAIVAKYGPTNYQYKDRKNIRKDLKSLFDGKYETTAEQDKGPRLFSKPFKPSMVAGLG